MTRPAPTVSVIIPAFNRCNTLRASVESVLRQTFSDFELVIVDDGSSDNTFEVASGFDDPRIRVVQNPQNRGAAAARNAGVAHSRAAWIAFQDSDDEWLPTKLERQLARLRECDTATIAAYCGLLRLEEAVSPGMRPSIRYVPDWSYGAVEGSLLPTLLRTSLISTQTLLVRRDIFDSIGGFDSRMKVLEDWDFALSLCQRGMVCLVDEPLVLQRLSSNSLTRQTGTWADAQIMVVQKHDALFAAHPTILSFHYNIIAGGLRRLGKIHEASRFLQRALALDPINLKLWLNTAQMALLAAAYRISARAADR